MKKSENYYTYKIGLPNHLSVGGLVVREDGQIAVNRFQDIEGYKDIALLMRETLEPNERLEEAVHRGLAEEFGMRGVIISYLGNISCRLFLKRKRFEIEKTTLYYYLTYLSHDAELRAEEDRRFGGELEWHDPVELIDIMRMQASRVNRPDVDESQIVLRYLKLTQNDPPII